MKLCSCNICLVTVAFLICSTLVCVALVFVLTVIGALQIFLYGNDLDDDDDDDDDDVWHAVSCLIAGDSVRGWRRQMPHSAGTAGDESDVSTWWELCL